MKYIVEESLRNFPFWDGGKDTAEGLTDEQLDQIEEELEANPPEDGWTDTAINDLFWFDRDYIYSIVGNPNYPKVFKVTHPDGRSIKLLVNSESEENSLSNDMQVSTLEETDEPEGFEDEEYEDWDASEFEETKFWEIKGIFGNTAIVRTIDDFDADDLCKSEELSNCSITELSKAQDKYVDWCDFDEEEFAWNPNGNLFDHYDIPTYAVNRICEKVLNPNDELDYYEVPDTFALNFRNQNIELNDKDIKNIDNFLNMLHEAMPEGFDIIWNKQTCESPYFVMRPEFGAGSDCVNLYVYSKSKKDETNV